MAKKYNKKFIFLSHNYDLLDSAFNNLHFFQSGVDGEFIGKLTVQKNIFGTSFISNEFVKLDNSIQEDISIKLAIDHYFKTMEYSTHANEDLKQQIYYGAEQCKACHSDIYFQWKESNHAHAFETLIRENRAFDLDCIGCHSTGYLKGGFRNIIDSKQFTAVQCESCHENLPFNHYLASKKLQYIKVDEKVCQECHTDRNSPNFDYLKYLNKIKHWNDEN
jgi:hypothetical protein